MKVNFRPCKQKSTRSSAVAVIADHTVYDIHWL